MRRYVNLPRIQRNHNTGRFLVFSGLALLAGGFIYSINNREDVTTVLLVAVLGTITSQFGIAMMNKWGRSPRLDERIDAALKGLDDRWLVLHYAGPTDHLLIGPPGTITFVPETGEGEITYEGDQWIQDKPSGGLLRRGGRKSMTNLGRKAQRAKSNAEVFLNSHFIVDEGGFEAEPTVIFLSDGANLNLAGQATPLPVVHYKKVKDHLRKLGSGQAPPAEAVDELAQEMGLQDPAEVD
jgi:hypothetical protein